MAKLGFRVLNSDSICATPRQMPIRAQKGPIGAQKGPIGAQKGPIGAQKGPIRCSSFEKLTPPQDPEECCFSLAMETNVCLTPG